MNELIKIELHDGTTKLFKRFGMAVNFIIKNACNVKTTNNETLNKFYRF